MSKYSHLYRNPVTEYRMMRANYSEREWHVVVPGSYDFENKAYTLSEAIEKFRESEQLEKITIYRQNGFDFCRIHQGAGLWKKLVRISND